MPSKPRRHQLEGALVYHLMNRANRRFEIFHDEEDYACFKEILCRYVERNGFLIYHYCLMPNHYHIEAEMENIEELPRVMAGINRSYTHYYHKKYKTSGFLWQGRFKSKAVQKNEHLLSCARYIENNPVRAKLVRKAEEYLYSSARFYALGVKDGVVSECPFYREFGTTIEKMRYNYGMFLADDGGEEARIEKFCDFNRAFGDKEFLARLYKKNSRQYPRRQGRVKSILFDAEVVINNGVK